MLMTSMDMKRTESENVCRQRDCTLFLSANIQTHRIFAIRLDFP